MADADGEREGEIETMLAIGDSAMWGQGLRHDRKYATQVYRALSGGERLPERNVKAHSGAVIGVAHGGPSLRHDYRAESVRTDVEQDFGPVETRTGRHEKPYGGLTILQQLDRLPYDYFGHDPPAARDLREEADRAYDHVDDVDLVLLDGGINDVGTTAVVAPWATDHDIDAAARRHCYDHLQYLIERTRRKFPTALIVVTGYFPFLSHESDLKLAELTLAFALVLGVPVGIAASLVGELGRAFAVDNVLFFNRRQRHYVRKAVAEADRELDGPGVLFASPGFGPENSTNADRPWLWSAPSMGHAEVGDERHAVCHAGDDAGDDAGDRDGTFEDLIEAIEGLLEVLGIGDDEVPFLEHLMCKYAASFHPNPDGADAYTKAILDRYAAHAESSVREPVTALGRSRQRASGRGSVRAALERYDLRPGSGLRAALAHDRVDSIQVELVTGDDGTDSAVFLELAGERWHLNTELTEDFFGSNDFEPGDHDRFVIDPYFSTGRTTEDPIRLAEIDGVTIHKQSNFEASWELSEFRIWLNGVRVFETTRPRTLEGDDEHTFPYPR
jgi:lysophospholipase L1-like esterase